MSRVRLLWWSDLSIEKKRLDNQQFTNIHLLTMDNLKEFRDIFGKSFGVGLKKKLGKVMDAFFYYLMIVFKQSTLEMIMTIILAIVTFYV